MIKFEKPEVWGWEHAIRGMRNPLNSWERSDSYPAVDCGKCGIIDREGICHPKEHDCTPYQCYAIGDNDKDLMTRLIRGGAPHRKFLRQIFVSVDITAPLYWWKEFDTYKVGTTANSCSTMLDTTDRSSTRKQTSITGRRVIAHSSRSPIMTEQYSCISIVRAIPSRTISISWRSPKVSHRTAFGSS